MRIALSNCSRIWGGAEKMTDVIARGLQARGHSVVVLCRPGSPLMLRLHGQVHCESARTGFDLNPVAIGGCMRVLREHRPEVLMTMTQKDPRIAGAAARLLGIPVVVRHPMDVPFRPSLLHRFLFGWLPSLLIANSRATRRTMLQSAPWLKADDVIVIHNGIDVRPIEEAAPADLGLPAGAIVIGFAGRFEARKGIRELVAAWPRIALSIPEAHLVLVGAGGAEEGEARTRLAGVPRVHWLGFRSDIAAVMQGLDVLVMPSRKEGFGLVLAEAMAAGTAVVASNATNFPELIDNGVEGRLFEVGNPAALADAVISLARDPVARERMGRAAMRRIRRDFQLDRMLDRYERVLGDVAIGISPDPRLPE